MTTQTERIEVEAVLRLALEELENCADLLKAFEAPIDSCVGAAMLGAEKAATAIKEALMSLCDGAQPAVAKQHKQELTNLERHERNVQQLFGTPQPKEPEQEPFGWYSEQEDEFMTHKIRKEHERLNSYTHKVGKFDLPLYTTPPQRTWVGLTGFEQKELMSMSARDAVFATEAKLKEKNNG